MNRLDKIVDIYKTRYSMHLEDFLRFMYEKVDASQPTLKHLQTQILEAKLRITEDQIKKYLRLISATQQRIPFESVDDEVLLGCSSIKFSRKSKTINASALQLFRFSYSQQKQRCSTLELGDDLIDCESQKQAMPLSLKEEQFELLYSTQHENYLENMLHLQSSFFQNESSVELLCEDNLVHLFQGNILHSQKQMKQYLIQVVQKLTGKEMQSTKFIYQFNPKFTSNNKPSMTNGCLIAKTTANRVIAVFALHPKQSSQKGGIVCLNNKKMMELNTKQVSSNTLSHFSFDQLDLFMNDSSKLSMDLKWKQRSDLRKEMSILCGIEGCNSIPTLTYQYFQIVFK